VDLNHLLFPSVHFYLCRFFSRTETLAFRHRAASSVSSHFSAVSPEWSLLICNDLNSTARFLFPYCPIQRKGQIILTEIWNFLGTHIHQEFKILTSENNSSGLFLFKEKKIVPI